MVTMNLDIANNMLTFLISLATLLLFVVGAIGWFIRHETELKYLRRDHEAKTLELNLLITQKTNALDIRQATIELGMTDLKDGIQFKIDTLQTSITSVSNQLAMIAGRLEEMAKRDR